MISSFKVEGVSKVLFEGIYKKMDAHLPRREPNSRSCSRVPLFILEINEDFIRISFKLLNIPYYDSEGDPEDHIYAFYSSFHLYQASDSIMCRVFLIFLQENA